MMRLAIAFLIAATTTAQGAQAAAAAAAQGGAGAAAQDPSQGYHVVELENSQTATAEQLLGVLTGQLGADKEKAMAVIQRVDQKGKAVVVAGSKSSCDEAATAFREIGMNCEVRPLRAEDMPSEYEDSDVIVAGTQRLSELIEKDSAGLLVVFYAPWCGHCKTIVPEVKKAATELKEKGITVAAIDGQVSPHLAQQLQVRGYPAIKWLKREGEANLAVADYQGQRDAASFVRFAQAAHAAGATRSKLGTQPAGKEGEAAAAEAAPAAAAAATAEEPKKEGEAAASGPAQSKLSQSKVGGAAGGAVEGVTKAKMPSEAAAEAPKAEAAAAAA
jgi:protein disulfide-isomerase-like protein